LTLHVDMAVGGGIGTDVTLSASGATKSVLHAAFKKKAVQEGAAAILQPTVPCSSLVIQATPVAPTFAEKWIAMTPIGLTLTGETGGNRMAPAIIADNFPLVIEMPISKDAAGNIIERDPTKSIVRFKHPFVSITFAPKDVISTNMGVEVQAGADIAPRDEKETDAEKVLRSKLRAALKDGAPAETCKTLTSARIGGDLTGTVDVYGEAEYVAQSAQNHYKVGQDIYDAFTKLNVKWTAQNLGQALADEAKADGFDFRHALDALTGAGGGGGGGGGGNVLTGCPPACDPGSKIVGSLINKVISDARLKRDVVRVDTLSNGIGLYRFRYLWNDKLWVGVLAQQEKALSQGLFLEAQTVTFASIIDS
jgi:hypothetical protein